MFAFKQTLSIRKMFGLNLKELCMNEAFYSDGLDYYDPENNPAMNVIAVAGHMIKYDRNYGRMLIYCDGYRLPVDRKDGKDGKNGMKAVRQLLKFCVQNNVIAEKFDEKELLNSIQNNLPIMEGTSFQSEKLRIQSYYSFLNGTLCIDKQSCDDIRSCTIGFNSFPGYRLLSGDRRTMELHDVDARQDWSERKNEETNGMTCKWPILHNSIFKEISGLNQISRLMLRKIFK